MSASPYLSPEEVDEMTVPRTQRAAQIRWFRSLLGIDDGQPFARRPDGFPLIGRQLVEDKLNGKKVAANASIRWSR